MGNSWTIKEIFAFARHIHEDTFCKASDFFPSGKSVSGVIHVALDGGGALNGYASRVLRILGRGGGGGMTGLQL